MQLKWTSLEYDYKIAGKLDTITQSNLENLQRKCKQYNLKNNDLNKKDLREY